MGEPGLPGTRRSRGKSWCRRVRGTPCRVGTLGARRRSSGWERTSCRSDFSSSWRTGTRKHDQLAAAEQFCSERKKHERTNFFFGWTEVETLELLLLQLLLNMTTKKREQRVSTENFKDNFERSCKAKKLRRKFSCFSPSETIQRWERFGVLLRRTSLENFDFESTWNESSLTDDVTLDGWPNGSNETVWVRESQMPVDSLGKMTKSIELSIVKRIMP